ncbi:RNA-guided endonuclease InsQ/TnpB family protein [Clostridium tetani]|uniref:Transposase n=1 Tax=Clostridium tetani TaxID=1513 RepID=A0ABY0ERQ1_CLOTA|nr:RNA-guided endonuclease TnpB family protein [Clostridium tetani]RXI54964.1 transposase [Clostridium tetani]RXI71715.1 transposase [Clostridium tetani]
MNKCIKVELKSCLEKNLSNKQSQKFLKDIQYLSWKGCNRAITYLYNHDMKNSELKYKNLPKIDPNKEYGKSLGSWIEDKLKEIMVGCLTTNVAQTRAFVMNRYKQDKKQGLLKGNVSLSNFKRNMPIIIHNKAYKIIKDDKGYIAEIGLFNLIKQKELGIKRLTFRINKLDGNKKSTLNKIINEDYKLGSGQIKQDSKGKWYLLISYSFKNEIVEGLDKDKILGIDLGIVNTVAMSIYNIKKDTWEQTRYKDTVIDGEELIHFRKKIEARKKSLSIGSKYCGDGRIGHGYKTRMKPFLNIKDKISKFRDTYNHKISRYIIDFAIKNKCGAIQMEDLSGFPEYQTEKFLKDWTYYDLQNKLKYKAEEIGIDIIFINPKYTSQRCSKCGNINNKNRDCKKDQAKFQCIICGYKENADINASKNISIPYIDDIIKEYLKENNSIKVDFPT